MSSDQTRKRNGRLMKLLALRVPVIMFALSLAFTVAVMKSAFSLSPANLSYALGHGTIWGAVYTPFASVAYFLYEGRNRLKLELFLYAAAIVWGIACMAADIVMYSD